MQVGTRYSVLTVLLFFVSSTCAHAAGIYKWVDAEGNVHYGEQAPPEGAKEIYIRGRVSHENGPVTAEPPVDSTASRDKMIKAMEGDRLARREKKQKLQKEQQQQQMQCARARDTLRQYKAAASLYKLDAQGNRQALPDAAKQQETQRLQAEIDKRCK